MPALVGLPGVVLALVAALAVLVAWPPTLGARARRSGIRLPAWRPGAASQRRAFELEWLEAFVAELRAGGDPHGALVVSAASVGSVVVPSAVASARGGGDVAAALVIDAAGGELLRGVAACWQVAQGSGAGLADALMTLADAARASERVRRELHAGLAEPRATAVVLAGLPGLGLVLGTALGAEPVAWLVGSPVGLAVLGLGVVFEVLGAAWAWRIATSLEAEL